MAKIVEAKSMTEIGDVSQMAAYLETIDLIDSKLGDFKKKYLEFKLAAREQQKTLKSEEAAKKKNKKKKKDKKKKRKHTSSDEEEDYD